MTMVDTIERDGTVTHGLSHKTTTALMTEARERGVRRIELHEYQEDSVWPDVSECPSVY